MAYAPPRKSAAAQKASSPGPRTGAVLAETADPSQKKSYASQGVTDNDVFLLPASDYQIMALLTIVAAVVRLFRIYQPTSVVFDEVQ